MLRASVFVGLWAVGFLTLLGNAYGDPTAPSPQQMDCSFFNGFMGSGQACIFQKDQYGNYIVTGDLWGGSL